MKNIFGMEAFDNIILREFNELNEDYQEIYRRVAGMEAAGIRVHRKRALGTRAPMAIPQGRNQRSLAAFVNKRLPGNGSTDFIQDVLTDGRRFRVLTVVDDFTR